MLFTRVLTFTWTQNDLRGREFPFSSKVELVHGSAAAVGLYLYHSKQRNQDLPVTRISWGLPSQHAVRDFSPLQARLTQTGQEGAISHWEFFNKGLLCTFRQLLLTGNFSVQDVLEWEHQSRLRDQHFWKLSCNKGEKTNQKPNKPRSPSSWIKTTASFCLVIYLFWVLKSHFSTSWKWFCCSLIPEILMIQDKRVIQCHRCFLSAKPARFQISTQTALSGQCPPSPMVTSSAHSALHSESFHPPPVSQREGELGRAAPFSQQTACCTELTDQVQHSTRIHNRAPGRTRIGEEMSGEGRTPEAGSREGSEQFTRQGLWRVSAKGRWGTSEMNP